MYKIWLDIINPSHAQYFNSLIKELSDYKILTTIRDRAETVSLTKSFGIEGEIIGKDYTNFIMKSANMVTRTLKLAIKVPKFDVAMSFENGMTAAVARTRGKKSILYCDNDLIIYQRKTSPQDFIKDLETKFKSLATYVIIPQTCYENFNKKIDDSKLRLFNGFKEDVYIADYNPDQRFLNVLPFDEFVVIRPESLASFYIKEKKSITPEIIKHLIRNGINIIYLPRVKEDAKYANGTDVFVPKEALNGLDLCYFANAVLTGSGTFAREAACMGTTAVSFFPSNNLLSVDQQLVDEGKIFHSIDPKEIVDYVLSNYKKKGKLNLERSKKAKKEIVKITKEILNETRCV